MAKGGSWKTISLKDLRPWVTRTGPHKMNKRILHWPYCSQCGLIALKNKVTRKALKKPCVWEEDR